MSFNLIFLTKMMMTRKHFQALALALASQRPANPHYLPLWRQIVEAVAAACVADNPLFDRVKFLKETGAEYEN